MELMNLNHPASHKCAFCKHWYDPMNQAIRPKAPIVGFWEYDPLAENQVPGAEHEDSWCTIV